VPKRVPVSQTKWNMRDLPTVADSSDSDVESPVVVKTRRTALGPLPGLGISRPSTAPAEFDEPEIESSPEAVPKLAVSATPATFASEFDEPEIELSPEAHNAPAGPVQPATETTLDPLHSAIVASHFDEFDEFDETEIEPSPQTTPARENAASSQSGNLDLSPVIFGAALSPTALVVKKTLPALQGKGGAYPQEVRPSTAGKRSEPSEHEDVPPGELGSLAEEIDSSSEPEIEEIGTCSIGMGSGSIGVGSGSYDIVMGLTEHLVPSESVNEYSDEDFEDDF